MKKQTKVIASSVAAIALCASLVAGSTFALFTSESEVNIAITAGKVNAVASLKEVATYTDGVKQSVVESEEGTKYMFENGGYATVSDNTVALNNVAPMDKVEITYGIENKSNIAVKYRTYLRVSEDDGLAQGFIYKINGEVYDGAVNWQEFTSDEESATFSIEFPSTRGNRYQEKSCKIACVVEAVQANAVKETEGTTYEVDGKIVRLQPALDVAQPGDTIKLVDDITTTSTSSYAQVANNNLPLIIDGDGHTIYGTTTNPISGDILLINHKTIIRNLNMECATSLEHGSGIRLSAEGNELTNVSVVGSFNMAAINLSYTGVSATLNNCYIRSELRPNPVGGNTTFNIVYGKKVYTEYAYNQICGIPCIGLFVSASHTAPKTIINNCDIDTIVINGPVGNNPDTNTTNERLLVNEGNKIEWIYDCTKDGLNKTLLINEAGNNEIGKMVFCPDNSGDFSTKEMFEAGILCEVTEAPTREGYVFVGWYCYELDKTYATYDELMEAVRTAKDKKTDLTTGKTLVCVWKEA